MSAPAWMLEETRLRRSKRGDTVHRAGCPRAANTIPWRWAENHSDAEIRAIDWVRLCKVCKPCEGTP
jgi:hypothetical protein